MLEVIERKKIRITANPYPHARKYASSRNRSKIVLGNDVVKFLPKLARAVRIVNQEPSLADEVVVVFVE